MVSPRQLEANRQNARQSTGPRTEEGKARSSQNALKHGLTASATSILPGEDESRYAAFHEAMVRDLKPVGILQREIVDDIVQIRWKLRRIPAIEAQLMRIQQREAESEHRPQIRDPESLGPATPVEILAREFRFVDNAYTRIELYRQRLTRAMHTELSELRKLREETGGAEEFGSEQAGPGDTDGERKNEPVSTFNSLAGNEQRPPEISPEPVILPPDRGISDGISRERPDGASHRHLRGQL